MLLKNLVSSSLPLYEYIRSFRNYLKYQCHHCYYMSLKVNICNGFYCSLNSVSRMKLSFYVKKVLMCEFFFKGIEQNCSSLNTWKESGSSHWTRGRSTSSPPGTPLSSHAPVLVAIKPRYIQDTDATGRWRTHPRSIHFHNSRKCWVYQKFVFKWKKQRKTNPRT